MKCRRGRHTDTSLTLRRVWMACSAFDRESHVGFLLLMFHGLPSGAQSQDSSRLTLAYFVISALDILDAISLVDAKQVIDWVYGFQITSLADETSSEISTGCFLGFRGSPSTGTHSTSSRSPLVSYDEGHLASTYSALAILKILGDNFSRVQHHMMLRSMRRLQQADGSFTAVNTGAETDLRFVYCAVAISAMLNDWSGLDLEKALKYILECQSYDDGFGLSPGLESHGGATYCAVAALKLMGYMVPDPVSGVLASTVLDVNGLIKWCVQKQSQAGGFQGRINKSPDTCYAFWVGGVLNLLGVGHLWDTNALRAFLLSCQSEFGGFSNYPGEVPDLLHAYYGLCGFSLLREPGLKSLCCELGISTGSVQKLNDETRLERRPDEVPYGVMLADKDLPGV